MKFNKDIIKVSGRCSWGKWPDMTILAREIPKEFSDRMGEAMYVTKGKANNQLGLELVAAGVPTELIKQVMDAAESNKYYYHEGVNGLVEDKYVRVLCPNKRQGKKDKRHYYSYDEEVRTLYKDTLIGRKLRDIFGEEFLTQRFNGTYDGFGSGSFATYNSADKTRNIIGNGWPAQITTLPLYMYFSKFDEEKQKAILANKTLSIILLERFYTESVPRALSDSCISKKTFVKTQVELFLEELYSLTQLEDNLLSLASDIANNSHTADRYNTLSEVGFVCCKIDTFGMWALLLAAVMNLERMGLTIYHTTVGRLSGGSDAKRGYKRLLQKINKSHTEYLKLINKGFAPEVARTTVLEQLKFWVSDWKNTDSKWFVRKLKDWQGQETDKQEQVESKSKSKSTKTLKLKPTIEDINKILSKKEGEEENEI